MDAFANAFGIATGGKLRGLAQMSAGAMKLSRSYVGKGSLYRLPLGLGSHRANNLTVKDPVGEMATGHDGVELVCEVIRTAPVLEHKLQPTQDIRATAR